MGEITISEAWVWLLGALSALLLFSNVAEKIAKVVKTSKAPNEEQDRRLSDLEEWQRGVDGKLNRDNDRLSVIEEGNRATQRALLALLDHGLDGNNIKQMQDSKTELTNLLINR